MKTNNCFWVVLAAACAAQLAACTEIDRAHEHFKDELIEYFRREDEWNKHRAKQIEDTTEATDAMFYMEDVFDDLGEFKEPFPKEGDVKIEGPLMVEKICEEKTRSCATRCIRNHASKAFTTYYVKATEPFFEYYKALKEHQEATERFNAYKKSQSLVAWLMSPLIGDSSAPEKPAPFELKMPDCPNDFDWEEAISKADEHCKKLAEARLEKIMNDHITEITNLSSSRLSPSKDETTYAPKLDRGHVDGAPVDFVEEYKYRDVEARLEALTEEYANWGMDKENQPSDSYPLCHYLSESDYKAFLNQLRAENVISTSVSSSAPVMNLTDNEDAGTGDNINVDEETDFNDNASVSEKPLPDKEIEKESPLNLFEHLKYLDLCCKAGESELVQSALDKIENKEEAAALASQRGLVDLLLVMTDHKNQFPCPALLTGMFSHQAVSETKLISLCEQCNMNPLAVATAAASCGRTKVFHWIAKEALKTLDNCLNFMCKVLSCTMLKTAPVKYSIIADVILEVSRTLDPNSAKTFYVIAQEEDNALLAERVLMAFPAFPSSFSELEGQLEYFNKQQLEVLARARPGIEISGFLKFMMYAAFAAKFKTEEMSYLHDHGVEFDLLSKQLIVPDKFAEDEKFEEKFKATCKWQMDHGVSIDDCVPVSIVEPLHPLEFPSWLCANTPLYQAAKTSKPYIVQWLLDLGAKANLSDSNPLIALMSQDKFSRRTDNESGIREIAKLLLRAGADPEQVLKGRTVKEWVKTYGAVDLDEIRAD
jgi:hypothetical protein